nr:hypothetical protein CCFAOBFC_00045 [Haslea ostrearia]
MVDPLKLKGYIKKHGIDIDAKSTFLKLPAIKPKNI